jgi:CheY-like chemotaxis protein
MAQVLVTHPSALVRASHRALLQACGWPVTEAGGRTEALLRLAGPPNAAFGRMVLVDLSNWAIAGTSMIRALRRQMASPVMIVALLPLHDADDLALHTARRAGANLIVPSGTSPQQLAAILNLVSAARSPGMLALAHPGEAAPALGWIWQQQLDLLAVPDLAAATVESTRQVFELLMARRTDNAAADAALALAGLAGGPNPLRRWATAWHPANASEHSDAVMSTGAPSSASLQLLLVVEAGGQAYGLRIDADTAPACWWTDGAPVPAASADAVPVVTLARLLGPTRFRRLLATDTATVVFRRVNDPAGPHTALRVDEVLGLEHVMVDPFDTWMARASGCTGRGVSADKRPLLVLDAAALMHHLPTEPLSMLSSTTAARSSPGA